MRKRSASISAFALALALVLQSAVLAGQPSQPTYPEGTTVQAAGLVNPRGFAWDDSGTLFVASAGTGGATMSTSVQPITNVYGPFFTGMTAAIYRIEGGCPVAIVSGLPSSAAILAGAYGVADLAYLDGSLYALLVGGGEARSMPEWPSGVYRIEPDGGASLVANLSAWVRENPVLHVAGDFDPETGGFAMVAGEGKLWLSQPNRDEVLTVTVDGEITRIVDLSEHSLVLTGIAIAPQGGVYVGTLTSAPFFNGEAKVIHVALDGQVSDIWTGLTTVTGVAVGPDGALYALEMSTGNIPEEPFLFPGTGRLVRQAGPDTSDPIATGLTFPIGLRLGPDGALYVSTPAMGANTGEGTLLRIPLDGAAPASPTPFEPSSRACLAAAGS